MINLFCPTEVKMRKFSKLILALSVLSAAFTLAAGARTYTGKAGELDWSFDLNRAVLTISGKGEIPDSLNSFDTPWNTFTLYVKTVNIESGVTRVGSNAFMSMLFLKDVTIPETVTEIGGCAFENAVSLENVSFPDKLARIGDLAFADCTSLKSVNFPKSLSAVGAYAFENCKELKSVDMSYLSEISELPEGIFTGCTSLQSAELPKETVKIGEGAFYNCEKLANADFPMSLEYISDRAYFGAASLEKASFNSEPEVGKDAFFGTNLSYTAEFLNYDGTLLYSETLYPGQTPAYLGETPEKPGCEFEGWDKELCPLFENTSYTALFKGDGLEFTVRFYDEDGQTLIASDIVANGMSAVCRAEIPDRETEDGLVRVFAYWSDDVSAVKSDMDVIAVYTLCGDINLDGNIDSRDAVLLAKYLKTSDGLEKASVAAADINRDKTVDADDLTCLVKYLAGFENSVPGKAG